MISRINLLKCKEGISEEEFRAVMMGEVRDVIAKMPLLRKCEINFVTDKQQRSHLGRGAIDIDGFVEMIFDSYGDMAKCMTQAGDALRDVLEPIVEEPIPALVTVRKFDKLVPEYLKGRDIIKRVSFCDRRGRRCHDLPLRVVVRPLHTGGADGRMLRLQPEPGDRPLHR